jgi:hypothetical protein
MKMAGIVCGRDGSHQGKHSSLLFSTLPGPGREHRRNGAPSKLRITLQTTDITRLIETELQIDNSVVCEVSFLLLCMTSRVVSF